MSMQLKAPDEIMMEREDGEFEDEVVSSLMRDDPRMERALMLLRMYNEGATYTKISKKVGLSLERVRQLVSYAKGRLMRRSETMQNLKSCTS